MHRTTLIISSLLVSLACSKAASTWQLNLEYGDAGFSIVSAAPYLTSKNTLPSGLNPAQECLAYTLEWLDVRGNLMLQSAAFVPISSRAPLPVANEEASGVSPIILRSGATIVRVPGPDLKEAPHTVRFLRNAKADTVNTRSLRLPSAFSLEQQAVTLPTHDFSSSLPRPLSGPVNAVKIQDTGPDANRFVIVVMGDGFTESELAAGRFSDQVSRFMATFRSTSPWDICGNAVNVYQVNLASNESGADYEDASPANGGTLKDTYLNAQYWSAGEERNLYLDGTGLNRAFAAADMLVGAGVWDRILVFVNSTKYGGSGGVVGVSSLHPSGDEVQIHELGHSFAGLADEYEYGLTSTNCVETTLRNVDCGSSFPYPKWSLWIDPGTPIPTPLSSEYAGVVGAFEGALYQTKGVFRPAMDCKMRTLGTPFCPVCREAHILKLFELIDLTGGASPTTSTVEVTPFLPRTFQVDPIRVPGINYRWTLDGIDMPGQTGPSLTITNAGSAIRTSVLQLLAQNFTPMVRSKSIRNTHTWNLSFVEKPTASITEAAVLEGDTGTNDLLLAVSLSSPSTETLTITYATSDVTAKAGADYISAAGQLMFRPGETSQPIVIHLLGDTELEPDESFKLLLETSDSTKVAVNSGVITIYDNDATPTVSIVSPANGAVYLEGEPIEAIASASKPHGNVISVSIMDGGTPLATFTNAPYTVKWAPEAGTHRLTAVAIDPEGRSSTSDPVDFTVLKRERQVFQLVSLTNAWKFDGTTNDLGDLWKAIDFGDSVWRGPSNAPFSSGNLPIAHPRKTAISTYYNGSQVRAFYFRTHFDLPLPPTENLLLTASNLVDDGAVFYLNGVEAGRLRMPTGLVVRTTYALPGKLATNYDVINLAPTSLVNGDNVLAVELHMASNSVPATFAMSLHATFSQTKSMERLVPTGVKTRIRDLLAAMPGTRASSVLSAGPVSVMGGEVSVRGEWVFYSPPEGYTNLDAFEYIITEGATSVVHSALVSVKASHAFRPDIQVIPVEANTVEVRFNGVPEQRYEVESTSAQETGNWQRLGETVTDTTGYGCYIHRFPQASATPTYRVNPL